MVLPQYEESTSSPTRFHKRIISVDYSAQ